MKRSTLRGELFKAAYAVCLGVLLLQRVAAAMEVETLLVFDGSSRIGYTLTTQTVGSP